MIRLWSINRWLRWMGFLLIVVHDDGKGTTRAPTRIGFKWMGWPPDRKWAEHCERSRLNTAEIEDHG